MVVIQGRGIPIGLGHGGMVEEVKSGDSGDFPCERVGSKSPSSDS
jgi:hypothetical protein